MLVLEYKKRNDHKIFHSSAKLVASDSGIDEASKFLHQSIITKKKKKKKCASEDWVAKTIVKHSIKIVYC